MPAQSQHNASSGPASDLLARARAVLRQMDEAELRNLLEAEERLNADDSNYEFDLKIQAVHGTDRERQDRIRLLISNLEN